MPYVFVLGLFLIFLVPIITAQEPIPEMPILPEGSGGCAEEWICSQWSECTNGQQTRTCTDSNNCGTTNNKPGESQSCGSGTTQPAPETEDTSKTEKNLGAANKTSETTGKEESDESTFFSGLKLKIIIIALLFLIAGIIMFFFFKKKTSASEQPSYGVIEEQKKEETKTVTEELKPSVPIEKVKLPPKEVKVDPKLAEYIQTNIKKGFTKEQIKKSLIKASWDAVEVDAALAKYRL